MGEPDRAENLTEVLAAQLEAFPLAEGRRVGPDVDHYVEDRPIDTPDQFGDPVAELEVHPADHSATGTGVVLLNGVELDSLLGEQGTPEHLEEEPPLILDHPRDDHPRTFEFGLDDLHRVILWTECSTAPLAPDRLLRGRSTCLGYRSGPVTGSEETAQGRSGTTRLGRWPA